MKNDDELLDEIIAHLRNEPVPAMPPELAAKRPGNRRNWVWGALGAGALAASLAGFLFWRWQASLSPGEQGPNVVQQRPVDAPGPDDEVVLRDVDLTEPFVKLEEDLDSLDAEIAGLRQQAELLDARRLADALNRSLAHK